MTSLQNTNRDEDIILEPYEPRNYRLRRYLCPVYFCLFTALFLQGLLIFSLIVALQDLQLQELKNRLLGLVAKAETTLVATNVLIANGKLTLEHANLVISEIEKSIGIGRT